MAATPIARVRVLLLTLAHVVCVSCAGVPSTAVPGLDSNKKDIEEFDLGALLSQPVTTATKSESTAEKTPAVVTVITSAEIRGRGLRTLAEALRTVPGFYDVYDQTNHNFGVRGVNGGARASGNVIKLMIDGQPVAFRSNTGNFFGEELIPIEAIERIEILRGPASALYGANAFLGVINIITRSGEDIGGLQLVGHIGAQLDHPAFGGGLTIGGKESSVDVLIAAQGMQIDRGHLEIPKTSPLVRDGGLAAGSHTGEGDLAQPLSILGKVSVGDPEIGGRVDVLASIQRLKSNAELSDYKPLTLASSVAPTVTALLNQNYRIGYHIEAFEDFQVRFTANVGFSDPDQAENINTGRSDFVSLRRVSVLGWEGSVEFSYAFLEKFQLTAGFDFQIEEHKLQYYDQLLLEDVVDSAGLLLRSAGTIIPGQGADRERQFQNFGGFLQAIYDITDELSATAGLRIDDHNIYDTHFSPRAALVYAPEGLPFILKFLYGTSFKAPSAEQLFTTALARLDIQGNDSLESQTAQTGEIAGSVRLQDWGELLLNVFVTAIDDRVEYIQRGLFLEAENTLQEIIVGAEFDARFTPIDWLDIRAGVGIAKSVQSTVDESVVGVAGLTVEQPLFPVFELHTALGLELPHNIRITPEISVISPRSASQSNTLLVGEQYETDWRIMTALAITADLELWEGRSTYLSLRARNLINQTAGDPGFAGLDFPLSSFSFLFTLAQRL